MDFAGAVRLAALRRSSRWLEELMLHSALSAEQGERSRTAWPSSRSPAATGKLPGAAVGGSGRGGASTRVNFSN